MDTSKKYRNRAQELERLINVIRGVGIANVEVLNNLLMESIQSYANQLHIKRLTKYELEYVWLKLLD
jgi:hypothetical protein